MNILPILASAASSIGSMIFSANQNNRQMNNSWDMMRASQEWTTSEREAMQDYQTSEREAAQQYNTQMWQLNNDFNSVGAQKERALEAGINPNSVLGSPAVASPVTTSPQSAASGEVVNGSLPQQSDLGRLFADNSNSLFDNMLKAQQAKTEEQRTTLTKKEIDRVMADTDLKESMSKLNESSRKQIETMLPLLEGKTKNEIEVLYQQAQETVKKIKLLEQETRNAEKQESVIEADAQLKGMQAKEAQAHADFMDAQKLGQESQNAILAAKAELAKQGIIVDANSMYSLISLLMSPDSDKVISKLFDGLTKGIEAGVKGAFHGVGSLFGSLKDWFTGNSK